MYTAGAGQPRLPACKGWTLGRNQLSGEIPPELGNLASLQKLDLGGNQFSGEIPPELAKLPSLLGAVPQRQPVERGDTAGAGQPHRPAMADEPQRTTSSNVFLGRYLRELGFLDQVSMIWASTATT